MKEKKKHSSVPYTFIPAILLLFKTVFFWDQLPYIFFVYGLKSFSLSMILDLGEARSYRELDCIGRRMWQKEKNPAQDTKNEQQNRYFLGSL